MYKTFIVLISFLFPLCVLAQSSEYFQQEVNYKIDVTLNDKEHSLRATMEFEYINNSPDTLHSLIIHLWPNGYKNAHTALAKQQYKQRNYALLRMSESSRGYIDSLRFTQGEHVLARERYQNFEDIITLYLKKPIPPGGRTLIKTPFYVKLPSGSISRLGHIGESYQISQWYPKPAVYDKTGWHAMPYLTQGEFYSEFGGFDVKITLPENYIVGATGDLQTESEIERLNKLSLLPAISNDDAFPPSSSSYKTLHYKQDRVHDFGWFADKRWIVRKGEVELPHSKRSVTTWAMFTPSSASVWEKAGIKSINDAVYYYSKWVGDYPYNICTAVDGTISAGGGMEYPTVTVIGSAGDSKTLKTVIVHEVGHNWFYGILGSNERDTPWMDEGINSFFETRTLLTTSNGGTELEINFAGPVLQKKLGLDNFSYQYLSEELLYLMSARGNRDQPIQAASTDYTNMNYGIVVYKKSAIAFNYLFHYLGEELFDKCMSAYFEKWKFKHPTPKDLQKEFEQTSGKQLDWFFKNLIQTTDHLDYRAGGIKRISSDSYRLNVSNPGSIPAPFAVDVVRDGTIRNRLWFDGVNQFSTTKVIVPASKGDILIINNMDGIPEYNKQNNRIRTTGLFKRQEPLELKMFTRLDDPKKTQLFWAPLVGWNNYNKWMVGIQLHNQTLPMRDIQWSIAPMYSIATNEISGFAKLGYDDGKVSIGIKSQRFGYIVSDTFSMLNYNLLRPYAEINLVPNRVKKDIQSSLGFEYLCINKEVIEARYTYGFYHHDGESYPYITEVGTEKTALWSNVGRAKFNWQKKLLRSDVSWSSTFDMILDNGGHSNNTIGGVIHQHALNYKYIYRGKGKKSIYSRLYYGSGNNISISGQRGILDYGYDELFLGRSETEGILSNQFIRNQGALAVPTNRFSSNMLSVNIDFDLPVKFPIGIYGGAAYLMDKQIAVGASSSDILWNVGVGLPLVRGIFQIYIPVLYSTDIKNEFKTRDLDFGETIMFELNLSMMNPFELLKKISL